MRYWKRLNPDNTINTVEGYSHNLDVEGAIEIDEAEHREFIASMPVEKPLPKRDLAAEIDAIKLDIKKLQEVPA